MFDLQADNFATNGGSTQTLVVAAGQLPFVMVDPTLSGSSAILYPPSSSGTFSTNPVQSLTMTSSDGKTKSLLCYGTAVDIGTIAVAGSNGSSTSEHIAVVVGNGLTGPVAQVTGCPTLGQPPALPVVPVLAVVNVSTAYTPGSPFTPQLVGFLQLPMTATDVTLNGSTALISTGSNILLVSLVNPSQPTSAGQITGNFGNWLAVTSSGIAVGSSNNSSGNGIQTTTLGSYIVMNMTPAVPQVDDSGKTTQAIQLTLNAQGQAADFQNAQVLYSEDGVQATAIPVGNLQPRLQTVTIPAGLQMTTSSPIISVTLTKPDGTQTPDVNLLLSSPGYVPSTTTSGGSSGGGSTGQSGSALSASPFSGISPAAIQLGSSDTTITVGGTSAASLSQVYVRGLDSHRGSSVPVSFPAVAGLHLRGTGHRIESRAPGPESGARDY